LGWAQSLEMEKTFGKDESDKDEEKLDVATPGGIAVETLLNMGTVSALTMQDARYGMYEEALGNTDTDWMREGFRSGVLAGLSMAVQQWINGFLFWAGGYLIYKHPRLYDFRDLIVSLFALLFGMFGLGVAFQDVADKEQTKKSASRIFFLMDRKSEIDPLSDEGKIVDYSVPIKSKSKPKSKKSLEKKKSEKKKRASSMKDLVEEEPGDVDKDEGDVKQRSSSSKKKKSSKKLLEESGDEAEKKPKSSKKKKKKKKAKKDDTLPDGESEDIMFVPPDEEESEEVPADVSALVAALEEKTDTDNPGPSPMD